MIAGTKEIQQIVAAYNNISAHLCCSSYLEQVRSLGSSYSYSPQECSHVSGCTLHCSLHTH